MCPRKQRVDNPERCIRTRGLAAAIEALLAHGPHATLDTIAHLAGCPKASLARVFDSKEALMLIALRELDRGAMESLRELAQKNGGGKAGALAAASHSARLASNPDSKGCPINAAGAAIGTCPWAQKAVIEHKQAVLGFYVDILQSEIGPQRALLCAQAISLISDGIHINATAGFCFSGPDAALMALSAAIAAA